LRHASLRQRGSEYVVVDEGSDNGTFAGATRLVRHAPHTLQSGDLLRFGRVWVEVRLGPAEQPTEVQASRELARRLVDAALAADERAFGMTVSAEGGDPALRLDEPRRPYLVGSKKGSDLRLTGAGVPSRCLELRRQADQLWVTLQNGATAMLADRALSSGERTAWPKNAVLTLGDVRLTVADPTAATLELLERGPTERLADDVVIDPPSGTDANDDEEEDEEESGASEDDDEAAEIDEDSDEAIAANAAREAPPARARRAPRHGWTRADAIVFFLALGMLALSLWAIRRLALLA
jgi:hypothetical protein